MVERGDVVLVDTMVIIEAHRVKLWPPLVNAFRIETVETCIVEAGTGDQLRRDYVPVDPEAIRQQVGIYSITDAEKAELLLRSARASGLHAGERDLLAHALHREDVWLLCCPDRAAIYCAHDAGYLDRCISLESLTRVTGGKYSLAGNYTEKWLSIERLKLKLGDA
jgi:hypothetical protein